MKDIKVELTPSSAANSQSNGLAEASVKNAKILLRKCIDEGSNFQENLCYFNQCPRADGYSPSELLHGRRVRSILPSINDEVDINAAKAARQHTDMLVKNKKQTGKPLPMLSLGDLCYRIKLDGNKRETLVSNPCEVIQIRRHGESYNIKDLVTNRIY